jgi:YidC/Oxa1 family membrane protein insertase
MDRKGLIGVVVCIVIYVVLQLVFARIYPPPVHHAPAAVGAATQTTSLSAPSAPPAAEPAITSPAPAAAATTPAAASASPAAPAQPEKLDYLENDFIKVTLSTQGASIKQIDLKKHREGDEDVILNAKSRDNVMAVTGWPGSASAAFQVQATPATVTYTGAMPNGVTWTRVYTLGKDYTLAVQDTLANAGATEAVLPAYTVSVGRAKPLLVKGHYQPISSQYIGAGWLTTLKYRLTTVSAFNPSGWFFNPGPPHDMVTSTAIDPNPLRWLAVQDQFFAVLLTPDAHHPIAQGTFLCYNTRDEKGYIPSTEEPDIEAFADFPELHLPAGQATTIAYTLYAGPREYDRLNALGDNQGELMNYDGWLPFSLLIRPMLAVLHGCNGIFHSYGVAIIMLTLLIKAITWPLQSIANRSGKRMQALAPKIKELQAKYKDQPEKISAETMGLYREYGVNPFGGCLPAFIQMPVFFSLYYMLQNAVELRGQHFLWVKDLTQPDTVFSTPLPIDFFGISHLTINPLPVMVTALMAVMMRMTPQMGDPQQQKIAQFMPLFFLFLFYNFAAALSLYYVVNNFVAIIQIYRNLKKPLPDLQRKPKPGK